MKRQLLKMMLGALTGWLKQQMEPADRPHLHVLQARSGVLIDLLPENDVEGPCITGLDEDSVRNGLDWLLKATCTAYGDDWAPISCDCLRLLMHRNLREITALTYSGSPSSSGAPGNTRDVSS